MIRVFFMLEGENSQEQHKIYKKKVHSVASSLEDMRVRQKKGGKCLEYFCLLNLFALVQYINKSEHIFRTYFLLLCQWETLKKRIRKYKCDYVCLIE